jgi:pimeloyl-ACP methyl ester carboxylesterase
MELNYHRAGSGPPLVLIHGIGSRWQVWDPVLPALTAERDVLGHGPGHDRVGRARPAAAATAGPRALWAIPGARLVTLRGCGHVPMYDDPEQVSRVLLEGSRE